MMVGNNEPFVPVLPAAPCAAYFNDCTTPDDIGADIKELEITFTYQDEYQKAIQLIQLAEQTSQRKVG